MNFLRNLFGKKPAEPAADTSEAPEAPTASVAAPEASADPANDPNLIRVFDAYGRELFITRDEWRKSILPDNLRKDWHNPDALYQAVLMALRDGFHADVLDAARHLYAIDPVAERATCLYGITLQLNRRLAEAEKVFRDHIDRHGESGVILTNLAKVLFEKGDPAEGEKSLRRGLELDPNQDNALPWYAALLNERGGESAMDAGLREIAALPASWRAQMYLAKSALAAGRFDEVRALYAEALARAGTPAPADLLMSISGDLGNAGQLAELLALVEPRFEASVHGLMVGNNLIKAHLDLGHASQAGVLLRRLIAQNRPDWREHLAFWDKEITAARSRAR